MEFDFFTFAIQIVNFLILIFFLNKFLFSKMRIMMEERNQRVNEMLTDADIKFREAEGLIAEYRRKEEVYAQEKEAETAEFHNEMQKIRESMLAELKADIEKRRIYEGESLKKEMEMVQNKYFEKYIQLITDTAEKVLHEVADDDINNRIVVNFLKKLDNSRDDLLNCHGNKCVITSGFELSDQQRKDLDNRLADLTGKAVAVEFFTEDSNGMPFIKLTFDGMRIETGFKNCIDAIKADIDKLRDVN